MLPKLCLLPRPDAVSLSEPLTQAQDRLVDILLQFHRVVKGALRLKGVFVFLRQFRVLHEPLERAAWFVIDLDFFGAHPGFTCKLLGRHEEVKEGCQVSIDGGQEGQFLKPFEPVIPDVLADNGSVFLLDETVVVLFVVTAAGEGEGFLFTPYFGGVIDKFRAIITVELQNRERDGVFNIREGLKRPGMGVVEEGTEFGPAGSDIGGGQGMDILACCGLSAVVNCSLK